MQRVLISGLGLAMVISLALVYLALFPCRPSLPLVGVRLYMFTSMACVLIEKMFAANFETDTMYFLSMASQLASA